MRKLILKPTIRISGFGKTDREFRQFGSFNIFNGFLLLIVIIAMVGCSKKKNDESMSNFTEIYPLKFGNYWTLIYTFNPDSTNATKDTIESIVTGSRNITFNGNTIFVYVVQGIFNGRMDTTKIYVKNQNDGVWSYGSSSTGPTTPYLSLKYPVSVGDSWADPDLGGNMICSSVSKQFKIGIGSFNCIEYQEQHTQSPLSHIQDFNMLHFEKNLSLSNSSTYTYYFYFQPGLGQIGQICLKEDGVIWYKAELISYKIN